VDRSGQVQAPDCGAPASRHGFSGELILLSVIRTIIEDIAKEKTVIDRMAWRSTGPMRLTECARRIGY